jgi:hypothetical protein
MDTTVNERIRIMGAGNVVELLLEVLVEVLVELLMELLMGGGSGGSGLVHLPPKITKTIPLRLFTNGALILKSA